MRNRDMCQEEGKLLLQICCMRQKKRRIFYANAFID